MVTLAHTGDKIDFLQHTTTNSSVQNTSGFVLPDSRVVNDWLQFHLPDNDGSWAFIHRWFPDFQELERSRVPGYDKSGMILSTGVVAWSTKEDDQRRIFVRLPSSALGLMKETNVDPVSFMYFARCQGATFSRLDFALDSFDQLDIQLMLEKLERHEVQTRWKSYTPEEGQKPIGSDVGQGLTVYVGSRTSESFLRVYDKTAEQIAKLGRSGASEEQILAVPENWVRVELESKKRKADALASALIEAWMSDKPVAEVITKHLLSLIDFKEAGPDSNRSRWLSADWWLEFLETAAKEAVKLPAPEISLKKLFAWVEHIAPALAVAANVDIDWLLREIALAQRRFRTKHRILLEEAGIKLPPEDDFETG